MANVHVFNIDGGIMTLASRGDIRASDIHSVDELEQELYLIANNDPKYAGVHTFVIDNITELQTLALESITTRELAARRKKDKSYQHQATANPQMIFYMRQFFSHYTNGLYVTLNARFRWSHARDGPDTNKE